MMFSIVNFTSRTLLPKVDATYIEGPITQDTVWTLVDSPFVVSKSITVYSNATLIIEPGVEVRFGGEFSLIILGKLYANGTNKPITFTSNKEEPEVGDWNAIIFNGTEKSVLIGCTIAYSTYGILVENGNVEIRNCNVGFSQNGIAATNSELLVHNTTISFCQQNGITITDSKLTIQESTISENQGNGILITGNEQVIIQNNTIMANGNGILLTGNETSNVDISKNIISANGQVGIKIDANAHSGITILNNIVSSNNEGFHISTPTSIQITNNSVSYNRIGILYEEGNHATHLNDIYGNEMGMDVLYNATVDAEQNYWGDSSGPYHESLNPNGRGNPVGGDGVNLDFIFFLAKPIGYINTPPTAVLLTDKLLVPPNEDVMFFATNSFDNDGRVDKYLFDFGDGSGSGWTTLSIFTHRYSLSGPPFESFNVTLTVMDDYGTTSTSVLTTITVQNLPSLQINVNLNTSKVHEGEQVSITVYVSNGTTAVENATVTLFSVKDGNFTESFGLTDANGNFFTTFTAPDITKIANVRIVARASKSDYADGSDYEYLEVSPFLSVQIVSTPNTVKSEETAQISIYVKSNEEPIANASVIIISTGGRLSSQTGVTDSNGAISLVFSAPQTTTFLDITITATATKNGYMNGVGETIITVEPKILVVQITTVTNATLSEAKLNISVHVEYDDVAVSGASVTITAGNGTFSVSTGTTDSYGNVIFVYTAPPVGWQTNITITAQATKIGYADGIGYLEITVNPRTFNIQISTLNIMAGESANIIVTVKCNEDATPVTGAIVTISSTYGDFSVTTKTTSPSGTCTFIYNAPQTTVQLSVIITVNVTKNGYINGENQTTIIVTPAIQPEEGWPLTTILLIIIPVIIAVVVVILIKLKIIVITTEEESQ